ncbi:MAG: hypothetical protein HC919_12460 [Oscillatoriales cyanobacterium SM2_2_1]|nr:hypothetical protein [Oscillatoriales cyanobacterium SM2_2_1]
MLPNPQVMESVEKLRYQVTVADVAAQTGLNLEVANREVMLLASLTSGDLAVAESGDITYKFSPNFRGVLLQRSAAARTRAFWQAVWKWVFYLIRISFGIILVVSIMVVVVAIVVAIAAINSQNQRDERSDDRRSGGNNWFVYVGNPFNLFYPSYGSRYPTNTQERLRSPEKAEGDRGFLENVFSFLFGDGDPNANAEERRYRLIAQVIRNHDGVVIAEQIAPYLDEVDSAATDNENFMLPVLVKFNGFPEVSQHGTFAYRFPDLQTTATSRQKATMPECFTEAPWQFSKSGSGAIALSAGLGIFYLVAALYLGVLLQSPVIQQNLIGFLGLVNGAFGFLLGYAILFLTIPSVRYFVIQVANQKILDRNIQRQQRADLLQQSLPQLASKLAFARQFAIAQKTLDTERISYSTEQDVLEQEFGRDA